MTTTATPVETDEERILREEQEAHDRQQAAERAARADGDIDLNPDPETGQLLKMPRVAVIVDDSDPSALTVAFSGQVTIERGDKQWVEFYNHLRVGKSPSIAVSVHVAGVKKTHRRDKDGNVDAVVETKSLVVTDLHLDEEDPAA
jgi:hypothetical protein